MKALISLLLLVGLLDAACAGTLVGTVRAEGKPGTEEAGSGGHYASHKYRFAERVDYTAFHDFVVYLDGPVGGKPTPPAQPVSVATSRVMQKGAEFRPHVLPVVVGTTVEWPNNDDIFHNVFSMSEAKPFDLDLYKGNPPEKRVTFDKPGRVDVFCSIHANMHCIVLVLENPYYALTDNDGRYRIPDVPAGTYRLKAWHERLPAAVREISVPETGEVKTDLVLGIKNLPKY